MTGTKKNDCRGIVNEEALAKFILSWIDEQDHVTSPRMNMLRHLPKQRTTYELNEGKSLTFFNLHHSPHLEILLAHLAGDANGPCDICKAEGGFFKECVILKPKDSFGKFKGRCTNCSIKGHTLCFREPPSVAQEHSQEKQNLQIGNKATQMEEREGPKTHQGGPMKQQHADEEL
ncbi:MAG: hypothetical protein Q9198_011404 [Flavoplaca austrocitrina]